MTSARYVVYRDKAKGWRWRLVAPNGRIIADSGEGYTRRDKCVDAVQRLRVYSSTTRVEVHDGKS